MPAHLALALVGAMFTVSALAWAASFAGAVVRSIAARPRETPAERSARRWDAFMAACYATIAGLMVTMFVWLAQIVAWSVR